MKGSPFGAAYTKFESAIIANFLTFCHETGMAPVDAASFMPAAAQSASRRLVEKGTETLIGQTITRGHLLNWLRSLKGAYFQASGKRDRMTTLYLEMQGQERGVQVISCAYKSGKATLTFKNGRFRKTVEFTLPDWWIEMEQEIEQCDLKQVPADLVIDVLNDLPSRSLAS
jgi:hypothetical protein